MPKLVIHEKGVTREHELGSDPVVVGRSSSCPIPINDEQASREHCRIEREGDDWYVVDLGSSNGTRLDGRKIKREKLANGGLIGIGNLRISFTEGGPAAAGPGERPDAGAQRAAPDRAQDAARIVPPDLQLVARSGPCEGTIFDITQPVTRIGRNADNDIALDDPGVSKNHAELIIEPGGLVRIVDNESRNGIRVNNAQVAERDLDHDDRVQIGATLFEFLNPSAAPADGAASVDGILVPHPEQAVASKSVLTPRVKVLGGIAAAVVAIAFLSDLMVPGAPTARIYSDNLLPDNPSFEKSGPGVPGWISGRGTASLDRKNVKDGVQALRLISATGAGGDVSATCWTRGAISVSPLKLYELSALARNSEGESVALCAMWRSKDSQWLSASSFGRRTDDAHEWRQVVTTFRPPSWATSARFGVAVVGQGTGRFDGMRLREAGTAPTGQTITAARLNSDVGSHGEFTIKIDGKPVFGRGRATVTAGGQADNQSLGSIKDGFPLVKGMNIQVAGQIGLGDKLPFTQNMTSDGTQLAVHYDIRPKGATDALVALEMLSDAALLKEKVMLESVRGGPTTETGPFENRTGIRMITLFKGPRRVFIKLSQPANVSVSIGRRGAASWRLEFPTPVSSGRFAPGLTIIAATARTEAAVRAELRRAAQAESDETLGKAIKIYETFAARFPLYAEEREEARRGLAGLRKEIASRVKSVKSLGNRARSSREEGDYESAERACEQLLKKLVGTEQAKDVKALLSLLRRQHKMAVERKHEAKAAALLVDAKQRIEKKELHIARALLEDLIKTYPDAKAVGEARELVKTLPKP
jgi:pSer/pThr/pTyr-binding forkhead associated (FHA) protein